MAFVLIVDREARDDRAAALDRGESALGGFAPRGWQRRDVAGCAGSMARGVDGGFAADEHLQIFVDGRLSALSMDLLRARLQAAGIHAGDAASDAEWLLAACRALGAGDLPALHGDIAVAIVDTRTWSIVLLRGDGGGRGLHHARQGARIVIATRAVATLRAAGLALDERAEAIAAWFALRAPAPGDNYFHAVAAVPPGAVMMLDADGLHTRRVVAAMAPSRSRWGSDAEAIAAWRTVLLDAVGSALDAARRPGLMLSGGIDSTLLAVTGRALRADLRAYSWQLPATPAADEAEWIRTTRRALDIEGCLFDGDDDVPLARLRQWPVEDDGPLSNPYRWLQQSLFAAAAGDGCDVLMSGNFGDHLYPDAAAWWPSAIADRGWRWALAQQYRHLRDEGPRAWWRDPAWRGLVRGSRQPGWSAPAWMLPRWQAALRDWLGSEPPTTDARSAEAMQDAEFGRRFPCMHGIDLVMPYRDQRVVEFAAALPAHFQYRAGQAKWLGRELLRGVVPDALRQRPKGGSLAPLFRSGVMVQNAAAVTALLDAPDARWPRYVAPDALHRARSSSRDEADLLLIWLCVSYELWWRAHWGLGPAVLASSVMQRTDSKASP